MTFGSSPEYRVQARVLPWLAIGDFHHIILSTIASQWGYPHVGMYARNRAIATLCVLCGLPSSLLLEEITFPLGHTVYFYIIISERTLACTLADWYHGEKRKVKDYSTM